MMNVCRTVSLLMFFVSVVFPSAAPAARWQLGPENTVHCKQYGATETFTIGDGENRTWYWAGGWGISFSPSQQMTDDQNSSELSCGKTAGGQCYFTFMFHFDKPISKFRFTTPLFSRLELNTGDIIVQYAAGDKGEYQELFRYGKNSEGYRQDGEVPPKQLDWISLKEPQTKLRISFVLDGFVGTIPFHAGKDDGAVLEYTTAVMSPEKMVSIKLIPDATLRANLYRIDEPIRAVIDTGPTKLQGPPELQLYDEQRQKIARTVPTQPMDRFCFADVPNVPPGCYEMRVLLPLPEGTKEVPAGKFILVHPPRKLTREQERKSPFGVVGISHVGGVFNSLPVDGPAIARLTGIHQMRGGTGTWLSSSPAQGVINVPSREEAIVQTEEDMKNGLVRRHSLAFTPGWAVDVEGIKRKGGEPSIHHPCKPEYLKDYAEYCRRLALATKGLFEPEFEIWNEPNSEPHGAFKGTFSEFVAICHTAADAILAVNPDARMILASSGDVDVNYVMRLLKAGLSKKYRIVDVHPYRHTDQGPEDGLLSDIGRLRLAIDNFGDKQAIVFSELGWSTNLPAGSTNGGYIAVTPFQQACFSSRTMIISIAGGVEWVTFHMLRDWGGDPANPEHNFGFVTIDRQPKPALSALATTSRHLEGAKLLGVVKNAPAFHHVWAWKPVWQKGAVLLTVWADTPMIKDRKPQWIKLPAKPILAEDLWGGPVSPDRLRKTEEGWYVLPGEDPLFIYLPAKSVSGRLAPLPKALRSWVIRHTKALRFQGQSPVVDGDLSEWGELPNEIAADSGGSVMAMGFAGIEEQFKKGQTGAAKFAVGYDDKGLYVATRVNDPDGYKNDRSNWWLWAGDCVRFFMSTMDTTEIPYYTEDHFQFIASPESTNQGPPQVAHISAATPRGVKMGDLIPDTRVKAKPVEGGWAIEVFVPWSYFGRQPQPGDLWSFDMEAGGNAWNGNESNWHNPTRWGRLEFAAPAGTTLPSK